MKYNDIKDIIIYQDDLMGNITLSDLINDLENCIKQQEEFEIIIYTILKNHGMTNEDIASIFTLSSTNSLNLTIKIIKNEL